MLQRFANDLLVFSLILIVKFFFFFTITVIDMMLEMYNKFKLDVDIKLMANHYVGATTNNGII